MNRKEVIYQLLANNITKPLRIKLRSIILSPVCNMIRQKTTQVE